MDDDTLAQAWCDRHDDDPGPARALRIHLRLHDLRDTRKVVHALELLGHRVTESTPGDLTITSTNGDTNDRTHVQTSRTPRSQSEGGDHRADRGGEDLDSLGMGECPW